MNASHPYHVIVAPLLSEESTIQTEAHNKYVFKVAPEANKIQIKKAIERYFKVRVTSVNTMNYAGKSGNSRMRGNTGRRSHWKKAIVTLHEGDTLDLL